MKMTETRMVYVFFLAGLLLLYAGCRSEDRRAGADLSVNALYLDIRLSGEEGDDNLTVLIRFREEENGLAVALPEGGTVVWDGDTLEPLYSKREGVYYELHPPLSGFAGLHTLQLLDQGNRVREEKIEFHPLELGEGLADTLYPADTEIHLAGLEKEDYVRIILTDTVFSHAGINRLDTVRDGRLLLSRQDLETLSPGPLQLVLLREYEEILPGAGGIKAVTYGIRREIQLSGSR